MTNDELLKMIIDLKEEFHFFGVKFEDFKSQFESIAENSLSAHQRINELKERLDQLQPYY